jgi:hypothetical protein
LLGGEDPVESLGITCGGQRCPIVDKSVHELLPGHRVVKQDAEIFCCKGGLGLRVESQEIPLGYAGRGCQGLKDGEAALEFPIDIPGYRFGNLVDALLQLRAFRLRQSEEEIPASREHRQDGEHPVDQQEREQ